MKGIKDSWGRILRRKKGKGSNIFFPFILCLLIRISRGEQGVRGSTKLKKTINIEQILVGTGEEYQVTPDGLGLFSAGIGGDE